MEPTEKPKFNWTRLIITIVIVIVTAGVLAGGTWYYMNQQAVKAEDAKNKEVEQLQRQINELKKPTANATVASADATATWKTYNNSTYHFSFKYPDTGITIGGYTGKPLDPIVDFISIGEDKYKNTYEYPGLFTITVDRIPAGANVQEWILAGQTTPGINYGSGLKASTIGGKSGFTYAQIGMFDSTGYSVQSGDYLITVSTPNANNQTFKSIFGTLKID
jgi:hypothetical protein